MIFQIQPDLLLLRPHRILSLRKINARGVIVKKIRPICFPIILLFLIGKFHPIGKPVELDLFIKIGRIGMFGFKCRIELTDRRGKKVVGGGNDTEKGQKQHNKQNAQPHFGAPHRTQSNRKGLPEPERGAAGRGRAVCGGRKRFCLLVTADGAAGKLDPAVGKRLKVFHIVRDDDHEALAGKLLQKAGNVVGVRTVQAPRRLVGKQDGLVFQDGDQDGGPLLFPARKLVRVIVSPLFQPEPMKQRLSVHACIGIQPLDERNIFSQRHVLHQARILKDEGRIVLLIADDFPRRGLFKAREKREERRFSAPRFSRDKDEPRLGQRKRTRLQRLDRPPFLHMVFRNIFGAYHWNAPEMPILSMI